MTIKYFISDVDGCLNDGKIYWNEQGKMFKAFGNYDHDGLKMLNQYCKIAFITADKGGWDIIYSRVQKHMNFPLHYVHESERYQWVERFGFENVAFMGDGYYDAPIIKAAKIGFAPSQARIESRMAADYITPSAGGEGAVMDACMYLIKMFKEQK
jgi:3-deoxy-D-manno-octulosonate 8-phosphate phosphatase (KDO 8-P phosphatase)